MIIKARYRDIPFEQIGHGFKYATREHWEVVRGQPLMIEVPATPLELVKYCACEGPHFARVTYEYVDGLVINVCPHICEIGD